ncbi:hypothetical protein D3C71_862730 [compost metagenome]
MAMTGIGDTFPETEILAAIDDWWADEQKQAKTFGSEDSGNQSVLRPLKEIDSHRIVRCLLEIEPIFGSEIPAKVIQDGGYDSIDELKTHLIMKLKELRAKVAA